MKQEGWAELRRHAQLGTPRKSETLCCCAPVLQDSASLFSGTVRRLAQALGYPGLVI